MDGLSAAASGMAVVSLTVQLVDSVREIRRFFRTLKDAPEELGRLIDLLENMELMLENIGKLVDSDCDISPSVLKAIQSCDKALTKLGALILKVKRNVSAQNPLKQSLGFFKLACKKQEVEEIETQLDRAVSNLNMVMTALNLHGMQRLWTGVSATNAAAATITEVVLRMEDTANQKGLNQKLTLCSRSRTPRYTVSRRSATHRVIYRGFLGTVTARTQIQSEDFAEEDYSKKSHARDEWSWVFIPSFLSRCVQVQCAKSFGSVERALRTYPILPDDHPAWEMCRSGEVTSIQKLFSAREISPYSIDSYGETLLHTAAAYFRPEICDLLLDMGMAADVVDTYGNSARGWMILEETFDQIERTFGSLNSASHDWDLAYFCEEYFISLKFLSAEDFRSQVEKWVTEENVNFFNPSPLVFVIERLCDTSIDSIEFQKWRDIFIFLIGKKADFNELKLWVWKLCLLEVLVMSGAHPFDAQTMGAKFLEMLDASNVDVAEYLNFECQHHVAGLLVPKGPGSDWWVLPDPRAVRLYINEEQPFSLSWDWWIDPVQPASLVLQEFRHFGQAEYFERYNVNLHIDLDYWPFIYPKWAFAWVDAKDKAQQRYNNRWQKKMIKQAKIQGTFQKSKMPGTWID